MTQRRGVGSRAIGLAGAVFTFLVFLLPWKWRGPVSFRLRQFIYWVQRVFPWLHRRYRQATEEQEQPLLARTEGGEPEPEEIPEGDCVVLLYSGGVDSTLAAVLLAERFRRVILCTFHNSGTHDEDEALVNVRRLNEWAGEGKFEHVFLSGEDFFRDIYCSHFWRDVGRWGMMKGNVCAACKSAVTIGAAKYCLDNGVRYVASGANREPGAGEFFIGQMPESVPVLREFFERYGITMLSPVYHLKRSDKILHEMGFLEDWKGVKFGSVVEGAKTSEGLRKRGQIGCDQDVFTTINIQGCCLPAMGPERFVETSLDYTRAILDEYASKWLPPPEECWPDA